MDISRADIKEFQGLYLKHFNIKLSDKMARIKLSMLVRQMEIVYQPVNREQVAKLKDVYGDLQHGQGRAASNS